MRLDFDRRTFQSTPLTRGETATRCSRASALSNFNPLPSHEGRPQPDAAGLLRYPISIHSPHTRGDASTRSNVIAKAAFQSTPLIRGETIHAQRCGDVRVISIHSPHTRGDQRVKDLSRDDGISIHSPHTRGDHGGRGKHDGGNKFQSTPLMRGETFPSGMMA